MTLEDDSTIAARCARYMSAWCSRVTSRHTMLAACTSPSGPMTGETAIASRSSTPSLRRVVARCQATGHDPLDARPAVGVPAVRVHHDLVQRSPDGTVGGRLEHP